MAKNGKKRIEVIAEGRGVGEIVQAYSKTWCVRAKVATRCEWSLIRSSFALNKPKNKCGFTPDSYFFTMCISFPALVEKTYIL